MFSKDLDSWVYLIYMYLLLTKEKSHEKTEQLLKVPLFTGARKRKEETVSSDRPETVDAGLPSPLATTTTVMVIVVIVVPLVRVRVCDILEPGLAAHLVGGHDLRPEDSASDLAPAAAELLDRVVFGLPGLDCG